MRPSPLANRSTLVRVTCSSVAMRWGAVGPRRMVVGSGAGLVSLRLLLLQDVVQQPGELRVVGAHESEQPANAQDVPERLHAAVVAAHGHAPTVGLVYQKPGDAVLGGSLGMSSSPGQSPTPGPLQIRTRRSPPSGSSADAARGYGPQIRTVIRGRGSGKSRSRSANRSQLRRLRWLRRQSHLYQIRFAWTMTSCKLLELPLTPK